MSQTPRLFQASPSHVKNVDYFPNRETWIVYAWIMYNDQIRKKWFDVAAAVAEDASPLKAERLANKLKLEISTCRPMSNSFGMYSDLMDLAIARVGFCEIASVFLEEVGYV